MEYSITCKSSEDLKKLLLNKLIKIELLNDTNECFMDGIESRYICICDNIVSNYILSYSERIYNNTIVIDKCKFNYSYIVQYYIKNYDNILYMPLIPKGKTDFLEDIIKKIEENQNINDITLQFTLNYDQNYNDFIKERLGEFNVNIV